MGIIKKIILSWFVISLILFTQFVYADENTSISIIYADGHKQSDIEEMNTLQTDVGIAPEEEEEEQQETNIYQTIVITDSEFALLREVLALEAQSEGLFGEMACCEVIFNRVLNEGWGSSVGEVLRKPGQFTTLKYVGSKNAWAHAGELEDDAISEVLRQGPKILPNTSYVYFDTKAKNGKSHVAIGSHYFGR